MHSRREKSALKYQFLCQCTSAEGTYRYWWKSKKYYHSYKRNVWSTRIREDTLYLISFKYYLGKYLEQRKEKITFAWSVTAKIISNKCKISVLFCISKTFIQWNMKEKRMLTNYGRCYNSPLPQRDNPPRRLSNFELNQSFGHLYMGVL